jgi:hypothetical protein
MPCIPFFRILPIFKELELMIWQARSSNKLEQSKDLNRWHYQNSQSYPFLGVRIHEESSGRYMIRSRHTYEGFPTETAECSVCRASHVPYTDLDLWLVRTYAVPGGLTHWWIELIISHSADSRCSPLRYSEAYKAPLGHPLHLPINSPFAPGQQFTRWDYPLWPWFFWIHTSTFPSVYIFVRLQLSGGEFNEPFTAMLT